MDASSVQGTSSFVILSVSIVGILAISLLLLAYYLFLTRCGLLFFWRPELPQLMQQDDHHHRISVSSVTTVQEPPPRQRAGLEEAAIRRIPTFRYRQGGKRQHQLLLAECAVCLADFRDGDRLRLLPPCLHAFHVDCIDAWLQATANCPLCRAAVAPPRTTHDIVVIDIIPTTSPSAADAEAEQQPAAAAPSSSSSLLPMRRSLSMDSCTDKRFYLALQRILQHNSGSPAATQEEAGKGESAGAGADTDSSTSGRSSRRLRRSFFSFSQSRGSRSAVLPL